MITRPWGPKRLVTTLELSISFRYNVRVVVHNTIVTFTYYSSVYSHGIAGGQNEGQKGVRIPEGNLPAL